VFTSSRLNTGPDAGSNGERGAPRHNRTDGRMYTDGGKNRGRVQVTRRRTVIKLMRPPTLDERDHPPTARDRPLRPVATSSRRCSLSMIYRSIDRDVYGQILYVAWTLSGRRLTNINNGKSSDAKQKSEVVTRCRFIPGRSIADILGRSVVWRYNAIFQRTSCGKRRVNCEVRGYCQ